MKVQCVIYFGQILMKEGVGEFLQEELVIHLVKIYQNSLIIQMLDTTKFDTSLKDDHYS